MSIYKLRKFSHLPTRLQSELLRPAPVRQRGASPLWTRPLVSVPPLLLKESDLRAGALEEWIAGSAQSVELEVGSSWGEFLCNIAQRNPEKRYIGVEISSDKCVRAHRRATYAGISNVCIVNMEAHRLLEQYSRASSLSAVHIYFPTPNQHSIRDPALPCRLINPEFVKYVHRALVDLSSISVMTDSRDCADLVASIFVPALWSRKRFVPLDLDQPEGLFAGTPLERQFAGYRRIYRFKFEKSCQYLHAFD